MNYKMHSAGLGLALTLLTTTLEAGTWQLGLPAESSRSPFIGDQRETTVLPMVNYYGERFSYSDGKLQYSLGSVIGSDTYLLGQLRSRQYYAASTDFDDDLGIEGMEDRDSAFELGLGVENQAAWGRIELEGSFDATSVHEGYELSLIYSYPQQAGRWLIEPAIGLQLQSSDLVDYYHGVRDSEARDDLPAYQGDEAVNLMASVTVGYTINADLLVVAGLEQLELDSSITDSPIVEEERISKFYLGLIYTF